MDFVSGKITNKVYLPRLKTDALFEAAPGSFAYTGEYDRAAKFVESHQSKNKALWKIFVEQFKERVDPQNGGWRGEFWGKMMRGACWIYKYTKDAELYEILKASVIDLIDTQDELGRISSYTVEEEFKYWDMWCRKYVLLGMQYFYDICDDSALKEKIIATLTSHLDYIIDKIGSGEGKLDILESTVHNPYTWGALNSSSILEPVVRFYSLTGEKKYLDFAAYIVSRGGSKWGNIYTLAIEGKLPPYEYPVTKAYESMSFFEGVLEYYRVSGDEDAKRAFINFMAKVVETDLTAIGCSGCTHELFDHSSIMQTEPPQHVTQETCVTVTLMKACYQALCLTGDAKYAAVMERSGYNAMLGSINFNKNTRLGLDPDAEDAMHYSWCDAFVKEIGGFTFDSYSPLYNDRRNRRIGGFQFMRGTEASYGCCACIGAAGVAVMPISAIMLAKDGIRINHYMGGKFTTEASGKALTLTTVTDYPYDGRVKITVDTEIEDEFEIGLRVPEYLDGKMTVNGKDESANELGYVILKKCWKSGDVIEIDIPLELKLTELNGKLSLSRGAIVYAIDERNQSLNVEISDKIAHDEKIAAHFFTRDARRVTFEDGKSVIFTDYASAGANWSDENCRISVWIKKA